MSGGTGTYEMARRLAAYGHEVHMITSDRSGPVSGRWYRTQDSGIQIHWLPVPYGNKMPYPARMVAFFRFAIRSALYSSRIKADVILASSTPLTIALPGVYAAKIQKAPLVFEVRDLWPELPIALGVLKGPLIPLARWLERFAYRNSSHIIALSPGMKEGIVRAGYPSQRVHVIPNGCDLELFQGPNRSGHRFRDRYDWLGERPLVLYAGTFGRINGLKYLVQLAFETWKVAPEVRFLAAGDGYERELVKTLARDLGVLDRNFFMSPPMPKADMPALFAAATISTSLFIDLPEMWSNSANKFFDSLAAGCPIAINYQGWQADLIRQTGAGLVLPANDLPSAAQQLTRAIFDKGWIARAGSAALQLARDRFDRDRLAKKLEEVLLRSVSRA